eukprot:1224637-Amphidinium_carterae.2
MLAVSLRVCGVDPVFVQLLEASCSARMLETARGSPCEISATNMYACYTEKKGVHNVFLWCCENVTTFLGSERHSAVVAYCSECAGFMLDYCCGCKLLYPVACCTCAHVQKTSVPLETSSCRRVTTIR